MPNKIRENYIRLLGLKLFIACSILFDAAVFFIMKLGKCCGYLFFFRLEIKGMSFIMSFMKILFFILLYIIVLLFVSNPAAVPNKGFKRANEVQKPASYMA